MNEQMMDRLCTNLGLTTVISGLGLTPAFDAGAAYLQRSLRQIEAAMPTFNLDPAMAHLAAEIAAFEDDLPAAQRVALIMLIASSIVALNEGSTRLPVTGPHARDPMARILGVLCADPDAHENNPRVTEIFTSIVTMLDAGAAPSIIARTPDEFRPLLFVPPYLYHQRVRAAEVRLADNLRPHLARATAFASDSEIVAALIDLNDRPQWLGANKMMLSDTQCDAVGNIATRRLSLVSGGPGTGKTSIVLAIVRLLVRLGIKPGAIALAASTGKAAHRMGESLRGGLERIRDPAAADLELIAARLEPVTVHRLLGYSPRRERFFHHRNNPLPATVAIIDESSMLDLDLMQRLAAALPPEARIVLLGDADQLPSVAAGAVFRDLVAAVYDNHEIDAAICTRLTRSYRMNPDEAAGSAIFKFAQSVNQGAIVNEDGPPLIQERADPVALRFEGVELVGSHGPAIDSFLDHWFGARIRDSEIDALAAKTYSGGENGFDDQTLAELRRIYSHLAAARILCVTRVLLTGADRINVAMHRRAVASSRRSADRSPFLAGEPVMIVRNDYDRNLFNGDQGIIVRVKRPDGAESPMAVFVRADRVDAFHLATLRDVLELCYATTIHKSQGSEFDCVAVILPDRDLPLLTRELLYTAATRARKSVVLVGSNEMVRTASARKTARYSGLAELLNPAIAKAQQ